MLRQTFESYFPVWNFTGFGPVALLVAMAFVPRGVELLEMLDRIQCRSVVQVFPGDDAGMGASWRKNGERPGFLWPCIHAMNKHQT